MVKRSGLDVRSNWIFHNNGLLVAQDMPSETLNKTLLLPTAPETLGSILSDNEQALREAAVRLYDINRERSPDGKDLYYPWLHTLKLANYADAFQTGLVAEAEQIDLQTRANNDYPRETIREQHFPYLDIFDELPFVWRVPGRMNGYNAARDGLWIQIKHRDHDSIDYYYLNQPTITKRL